MNRKIVVDIEKPVKGQPIIWKDDEVITTCDIHVLLPELKKIDLLSKRIMELEEELKAIKELAEQNAKDIRIDRGLEDEE